MFLLKTLLPFYQKRRKLKAERHAHEQVIHHMYTAKNNLLDPPLTDPDLALFCMTAPSWKMEQERQGMQY